MRQSSSGTTANLQSQRGSSCQNQKDVEANNSHRNLHARRCHRRGETSASAQCVLCRLSASEATGLAPSKEASSLAIGEAVLGHSVVALRAAGADAEVRLDARSELVVVNASETQGLLATCILLLSNSRGIGQSCLVIGAACTSGLQARLRNASGEPSAGWQVILGRLGAAETTSFAPAEQACGLAVLEAILCGGVVALGAACADAEVGLDARRELVMVDTGQTQGLLAACILLLPDILGICECCLVVGVARTGGCCSEKGGEHNLDHDSKESRHLN